MRLARHLTPLLGLWLTACSTVGFDRPGGIAQAAYTDLIPYFAEFCALSQIKQKRGFGAEIRGEIGGHAVFYLHGACRAAEQGQTTLRLCDEPAAEPADGVGLSMNAHFRNAKWIATPGRDFFFHGNMAAGEPLTRAGYAAVQAEARRLGIYDGIAFHKEVFDDMPEGMARETWKYEVSVATDYAISLGRGRFCARVPVNRAQLAVMVGFLNEQNAPYREGREEFRWSLFQDNCIHLAHNALAAAGVWAEWPTGRPFLLAMFDFPVPRNEFVNLMRRTGDASLLDPAALHADPAARRALLQFGQLPLRPGALMESRPPQRPNEVYDTELKLIFYDDPTFGPYQGWFDEIQDDPRRHDLRGNLAWVAGRYREALVERRPLAWWLARRPARDDPAGFGETYRHLYALLEQGAAAVEARLAGLDAAGRR
ncbi:hypothetical protein [Siccirubricoccus sp. G192]|uniref:hypothetical protein n=1 Tax=Siccirubricoccus sp. G192 TaxID=2849651 RepID=UPI001C2B77D2|nr:hypothetical protein [Siccirubricoccus sp. G192]MBV1795614.1 hypothetical protein [Siccirubricoccus sp. G192]